MAVRAVRKVSWKATAASKSAKYFISALSTARRWARLFSPPRGASSPSKWAVTASASAVWWRLRSNKNTTPTASSGPSPSPPSPVPALPINYKEEKFHAAADKLYQELQRHGVDVLLDDRDERPGVKFKDGDLVGI